MTKYNDVMIFTIKTMDKEGELVTRVSWMYYFASMHQQEIADELNISRIKVTRLLKQALDSGVVDISIKDSSYSLFSLENELKSLTGLKYCVVVPSLHNLSDVLSRGTAHLCMDIIKMKGNLGVGMTRSLCDIHKYLNKKDCGINSVVSIGGSTSPALGLAPWNIGFHIAQALGIDFYTIWAPLLVSHEENATAIKKDKYISTVLEMASNVDYALVGIGDTVDSQLLNMKYISDEDLKNVTDSGAKGELMGSFFSIDGKKIKTGLEKRIVAVEFPMKCPVIAVAGGIIKAEAIVSLLRSGILQGLVTDETAALEVLKLLNLQ
jgi:DNA-binding transcriptional regulator LsrR (DeoR family)